jgi:hypothetical protein
MFFFLKIHLLALQFRFVSSRDQKKMPRCLRVLLTTGKKKKNTSRLGRQSADEAGGSIFFIFDHEISG